MRQVNRPEFDLLSNGGRTEEQLRTLKDVYGANRKVVDAIADLRVFANREDIDGADRNNICECVFARACRRLFGSTAVVFFLNVAYVDLPDEDGTHRINRFMLSAAMRRRIVEFDKTGVAHPGGFILRAPSKSQRLDKIRERDHTRRSRPGERAKDAAKRRRYAKRRRAVIVGQLQDYSINKKPAGTVGYVRNGSGMAHFVTVKKDRKAA